MTTILIHDSSNMAAMLLVRVPALPRDIVTVYPTLASRKKHKLQKGHERE
jgi:hypothetical protein